VLREELQKRRKSAFDDRGGGGPTEIVPATACLGNVDKEGRNKKNNPLRRLTMDFGPTGIKKGGGYTKKKGEKKKGTQNLP